ncbi:MAG TPA: selenocysteine-specific translation elongation factor [Thermoanaerobacterales bacterium]|nr:selenocysteine-specific translation elongation factor [Thermoanaerobacterales bacterium]
MKHVIIGTAGHIDHGKTALIKALTNIETDRLIEEKERGITIDLGFAYFDLPSGKRAGIIDVPGHEKFIKNMLAGVSGIDIVLLVVAADEGMMPQTYEHLNILSLLDIKKGIIVISKKDIVHEDWLQLVIDEISAEVKGTFLEKAPIIPVSSKSGEGLKELIHAIDLLTQSTPYNRDIEAPFRLPIDRVFIISGFGTVVTGTLISGSIKLNDEGEIVPKGYSARVRSLQVHGINVNEAFAGQRVAINLVGVKPKDIKRGDVFTKKGSIKPVKFLDGQLFLLKNAPKSLKNLSKIRFYTGTKEVICCCTLLDKKIINPGEEAFVQFQLDEEIAVLEGDRYVLRSYSPIITIGGGKILKLSSKKVKPFNKEIHKELILRYKGDSEELLNWAVKENSKDFPTKIELISIYGKNDFDEVFNKLIKQNKIAMLKTGQKEIILHKEFIDNMEKKIIGLLENYHKKFPLKKGVHKEELREKLKLPLQGFQLLLKMFQDNGTIRDNDGLISIKDFKIMYSPEQENIKSYIIEQYLKGGFEPPVIDDLIKKSKFDSAEILDVYNSMIDTNILIKIEEGIVFHRDYYIKAKEILINNLKAKGKITLGEYRNLLNTTRKIALPLLEHFDQIKLTQRNGDIRILR